MIKAFENYGDAIGGLSNLILPGSQTLVKAGQSIASNFKNESLEHYKGVVEKLVIAADCNFVIFIDDIDRLNIDEIQSVFKLVKLVGDFPRFSYVLAFDDELVASSLGHKFGGKTRKDGYDFLEKIIQVPLHLPKASTFALRRYSIDLLNETLDKLKIQLSKKDSESFLSKFDSTFMPGLRNARVAVRLANSIAFSVPLLQGEVNLADLMIVDAIKAFYPELYQFIKQNPILFLTYYDLPANSGKDYKEGAKKALEDQVYKYGNELGKKLLEMFWELFPQLSGLYNNVFPGKGIIDTWYKDQRICSMYYFDRYFSFSVREGDISDNYFQQLFEEVDKTSYRDFSKKTHL